MPHDASRFSTEKAGNESGSVTRDVFNSREAAQFLRISERSLWTLMRRKEIKSIRIGRSVRYSMGALREFIAAREN